MHKVRCVSGLRYGYNKIQDHTFRAFEACHQCLLIVILFIALQI
jgi:hypothetical protein